jgi:hypothetical protein
MTTERAVLVGGWFGLSDRSWLDRDCRKGAEEKPIVLVESQAGPKEVWGFPLRYHATAGSAWVS